MKKINVLMMMMILFSLIVLSACGTNKLDGDYVKTSTNLFGNETKETLKFEKDKVSLVGNENSYSLEGTYTISKNNVEITIRGKSETGRLSKDKKTLIFESSNGLIPSGSTYVKEDE
ncbi:hypothetical protein [Carnobacterium divergens]|uniref:hypothetical protein n=1 Tax=Carnobacterium divergens TaxID=2748 RepID=UPI0010727B63|nr:hypothetical protein [Carnobacterium divergens]TFI73208.1 hypothetical protein CKN81_06885 [Carnobacterium divergens]